jgi:predicted alpha/beta superfamily hydrolase
MVIGISMAASVFGSGGAAAQADGAPVSIGTYRVINSKVLEEARRLLVHLPRGYEGSSISYPVLYHTYGDYLTYYADAYTALERLGDEARTPQIILVGIDNIDRYRDLRPLQRDGSPAGIDNYTRFVTEEVIPFVESEYRTAGYRILAGPQAGAVFGLYTLQNNPDLFDAFILNNPFTSRPNARLLLEQAGRFYVSRESLQKFLFITYGGSNESPEDNADVERFAGLAAPAIDKGLDLRLNDISGNDEFIVPLCLEEGLRALFDPYYVPLDRQFETLAEIDSFYSGLSAQYGYNVAPSEWAMTRSADALIAQKEYAEAVEILDRQTSLYPNKLNGWWRLAGIAAQQGDNARAIELYRKCVEIDPSVRNFVERRINAIEQGES